ncbi:MAG TPA: aminotransferase class V-fold PLP-dependent enzyme [Solirubrobacteraceae bacterium]|nr:aminotransferase class V-fold PLP-dependent enzyme [Solirubrobacteraceae bacterium]
MAHRPAPVTDLAWSPEQARELGGGVLDLWTELLARLPDERVTREREPAEVAAALALPVPEEPMPTEAVLAHLRALTFDQSLHMGHPAYFAYITGAGTVPGAAAELLAAGLNQCSGGYRLGPGAAEIELHLTRWLASRFGLPEGAGGMIMTGGAMANFVGLKCARDQRLGVEVRERGVAAAGPVAVYASEEAHVVIRRAADMLGLGADSVRAIAVDGEQRMRVDALREALARDVAGGVLPLAVSATAGTTTTGSVDPLPELAALAREHGAWFHVDAAYGGAVVLSDTLRPLLAGTEHADSIAVDPHKWMYTPQSAGCVLLRDFGHLSRSFHADASYIWLDEAARHGIDFAMHGPQFSRGFAALKVWVSLLAHGRAAYARRIEHDVALAAYLGELVAERDEWELMCPPRLSICCFRHRPAAWAGTEEELDRHNERLMTAIHADGRVYCSNAVIDGRFGLRACIVNFRTEAEDVERLLDVAEELAAA